MVNIQILIGGSNDLHRNVVAHNRSVCFQTQPSTPGLLLQIQGPEGSSGRRAIDPVVRDISLRIPTRSLIQKVNREDCTLLFIAPTSFGFIPPILQLVVELPLTFPLLPDLLRMPGSRALFNNVEHLHLMAWTLSRSVFRTKIFLKSLLSWQPELEDRHHSRYILRVCDPTLTGAEGEKSLQLVHLLQS